MSGQVDQVVACLGDAQQGNQAIVDAAAWAAARTALPLSLMKPVERPPRFAPLGDFNGAIWLGPANAGPDDAASEQASCLALRRVAGDERVRAARRRAQARLGAAITTTLLHDDVVAGDALPAGEHGLLVCGTGPCRHAPGASAFDARWGLPLRRATQPVLWAPEAPFRAPEQWVMAFDGSTQACEQAERLADHPLLTGLPVLLALSGATSRAALGHLQQARQGLQAAGFTVDTAILKDATDAAIAQQLAARGPALLALATWGGSPIRRWLAGLRTAALLRANPALLLLPR